MTWTYTPDFTTTRDQIRRWIGDTDTTDQQLTDEEIVYAYAQAGSSVLGGAVVALEWLVSKYTRLADSSVSDLSISYSQIAAQYRALLKDIQRQAAIGFTPIAGGVSISRVSTVDEDTDRVDPAFKRGMMSNPNAAESWAEEDTETV